MAELVLVVEDEEHVRELVSYTLQGAGYRVHAVVNGSAALESARRTPPDLVVLDIRLPEVDGWEVCRRLRAESDVPILMMTALTDDESLVKGLRLGADDTLGWLAAWTADAPADDERSRRMALMCEVAQRVGLALERDALQGYTELVRGPVDPSSRDRWLSIVQVEAAQLSQVVDQLLDVSRLDSGRFHADRREVELRVMIDRVVEQFAQQAALSGHSFTANVADSPRVFADPVQVERVLRNLISNVPDSGSTSRGSWWS